MKTLQVINRFSVSSPPGLGHQKNAEESKDPFHIAQGWLVCHSKVGITWRMCQNIWNQTFLKRKRAARNESMQQCILFLFFYLKISIMNKCKSSDKKLMFSGMRLCKWVPHQWLECNSCDNADKMWNVLSPSFWVMNWILSVTKDTLDFLKMLAHEQYIILIIYWGFFLLKNFSFSPRPYCKARGRGKVPQFFGEEDDSAPLNHH